jgi:N-acetylmuramoyl-L-alanine amidase
MTKDMTAPAAGIVLLGLAAWGYMQYQKRQEEKPPINSMKVLLDPGHEGAGLDPGATRVVEGKQIIEADCNLSLALAVRDYLKQRGTNVVMTRDRATRLNITARKDIIRRVNPDVFVSIHHNSPPGGAENATGTLVMVNGEEDKAGTPLAVSNRRLAGLIADKIGPIIAHGRSGYESRVRTDQEASGITYGVLAACREIGRPGVLLETAFITDPVWQQDRLNPSYVISLATALGDAVISSAPAAIVTGHKAWREGQHSIGQRFVPCPCHAMEE